MSTDSSRGQDVRAASVPLPPSMANVAEIPPAYIGISDEGDECIVKRFSSKAEAEAEREVTKSCSGGACDLKVMPTAVAFAAPDMLSYISRRHARLVNLTKHDHKHGSRRLEEKAELEEIVAMVGGLEAVEAFLGAPEGGAA